MPPPSFSRDPCKALDLDSRQAISGFIMQSRGNIMFPEPLEITIRGPQSSNRQGGEPATAEHKVHPGADGSVAASPEQIRSALRIHAALRAAYKHEIQVLASSRRSDEWTFVVKPLPRPPLVAAGLEELNGDDLLANDSPGG
jgi:hypothetical protein